MCLGLGAVEGIEDVGFGHDERAPDATLHRLLQRRVFGLRCGREVDRKFQQLFVGHVARPCEENEGTPSIAQDRRGDKKGRARRSAPVFEDGGLSSLRRRQKRPRWRGACGAVPTTPQPACRASDGLRRS